MSSALSSTDEKTGLGRFGTIAGLITGLIVGIGISIVHSQLSDSMESAPAMPAPPTTALPLPAAAAKSMNGASLAEQLAEQVKIHRESVSRHELEPRDSLWATETERALKDGLTKLASRGSFQLTSVDCRTTSCVAYLSAPTYQHARQAWPTILNAHNDVQCGTEVTLDAPPPGESAFDFSVVYDCKRAHHL